MLFSNDLRYNHFIANKLEHKLVESWCNDG